MLCSCNLGIEMMIRVNNLPNATKVVKVQMSRFVTDSTEHAPPGAQSGEPFNSEVTRSRSNGRAAAVTGLSLAASAPHKATKQLV